MQKHNMQWLTAVTKDYFKINFETYKNFMTNMWLYFKCVLNWIEIWKMRRAMLLKEGVTNTSTVQQGT